MLLFASVFFFFWSTGKLCKEGVSWEKFGDFLFVLVENSALHLLEGYQRKTSGELSVFGVAV